MFCLLGQIPLSLQNIPLFIAGLVNSSYPILEEKSSLTLMCSYIIKFAPFITCCVKKLVVKKFKRVRSVLFIR